VPLDESAILKREPRSTQMDLWKNDKLKILKSLDSGIGGNAPSVLAKTLVDVQSKGQKTSNYNTSRLRLRLDRSFIEFLFNKSQHEKSKQADRSGLFASRAMQPEIRPIATTFR
jgi:hypothetical protein